MLRRAIVASTKSEKPAGLPISSLKSKVSTRESRFLHLLDRTDVEAVSLVGSKDRILPRTSSGIVLIKSLSRIETFWADIRLGFLTEQRRSKKDERLDLVLERN